MRKYICTILIFGIICLPAFADKQQSSALKDNLSFEINNQKELEVKTKTDIKSNEIEIINDNKVKAVAKETKTHIEPDIKLKEIELSDKNSSAGKFNPDVLNISLLPANEVMPEGIIYKEDYMYVDAINPQKTGNVNAGYPGLRGPNQLIVYTPSFGLRTGTNEFGTEAIIENNMVVRLNGADSVIPKNGFVISGHGKAKTWITQNIQAGTKVYIDYSNNAIRIFLTPESLIFAAKDKLGEVTEIINYYKIHDTNYNDKKAEEYIEESLDSLKKAEKKPERTQNYISEAMNSLDNAIKNAIPYYEKELKGIWVRPIETTPEHIENTVERISKSGFTDIFLETYFHGKTIYPSKYLENCGVISQREEFAGFDPLQIWIKEAHKRNMKLHIWFETFYVGNDNPGYIPQHVLSIFPSWANKRLMSYDSDIPVPSLSEHNGYFLDPANYQVQTYLKGILNEIIQNYNPDGINLDYIRYPQTVDVSYSNYALTNWGYTNFARNEFKYLYGIDPIEIKFGTGDWELWSLYRQRKISEFVNEVKNMTKPKNILLTAVVFPDLKKSKNTKMQDWKTWSMNNYIDGITPLILTGDKNTAILLLKDVIQNTSPFTNVYPGLFVTFMGGTFDDLLIQIHKTREFKTKGTVLFDYAHLNDKYIEALTTRVFNKSYSQRSGKKYNNDTFELQEEYKPKKKKKLRGKNNDKN